MKEYKCTGLDKEYIVEANSSTAAKIKAGTKYKKEGNAPYTASFYAQFFNPRLLNPRKPGREPNLAQ